MLRWWVVLAPAVAQEVREDPEVLRPPAVRLVEARMPLRFRAPLPASEHPRQLFHCLGSMCTHWMAKRRTRHPSWVLQRLAERADRLYRLLWVHRADRLRPAVEGAAANSSTSELKR